jgi:hypothetical protein
MSKLYRKNIDFSSVNVDQTKPNHIVQIASSVSYFETISKSKFGEKHSTCFFPKKKKRFFQIFANENGKHEIRTEQNKTGLGGFD